MISWCLDIINKWRCCFSYYHFVIIMIIVCFLNLLLQDLYRIKDFSETGKMIISCSLVLIVFCSKV